MLAHTFKKLNLQKKSVNKAIKFVKMGNVRAAAESNKTCY